MPNVVRGVPPQRRPSGIYIPTSGTNCIESQRAMPSASAANPRIDSRDVVERTSPDARKNSTRTPRAGFWHSSPARPLASLRVRRRAGGEVTSCGDLESLYDRDRDERAAGRSANKGRTAHCASEDLPAAATATQQRHIRCLGSALSRRNGATYTVVGRGASRAPSPQMRTAAVNRGAAVFEADVDFRKRAGDSQQNFGSMVEPEPAEERQFTR